MCSSRTASAIAKMLTTGRNRFFSNDVMLMQRTDADEIAFARAAEDCGCLGLCVPLCPSAFLCLCAFVRRAVAAHFLPGHCANRVASLLAVPPTRPGCALQPDDVRRRAESRRADRNGHRQADHAAMET